MHALFLRVEDRDYEILFSRFETHQKIDDGGNITSPMQHAFVYLELVYLKDDFLLTWATAPNSRKDLVIEQYFDSTTTQVKSISLKNAVCTQFEEKFKSADPLQGLGATSSHNFITSLTLTAGEISVADASLPNF